MGHRLPTRLDHLKPDQRNKMEILVWKQEVYHDANVRRLFRQGDEVWVQNECKQFGAVMKRKHVDQLRSRAEATDDRPKPTVVNQQQEVEVQEPRLPEQQLIAK
ncbi:hypothetical protein J437_LFUL019209 [Ladona fulva]|uniref:Uncharacterized protein n=1 Tax=Ladona fulva TaxID=123851 RepID=A0A8K0KWW6_LADFU|nr:hypothetical protein J437_LFUL019209 [Ladona fulva]